MSLPVVVCIGLHAQSTEAALRILSERLVEAGYAEPGYAEDVIARELVFPTGLPTNPPVAIPHADPGHVLQPAIAVGVFDTPVGFAEMGSCDPAPTLQVRLAFLLAMTEKSQAVQLLRQLTAAFRNHDLLARLQAAATDAEAVAALQELLPGYSTPTVAGAATAVIR
jgi:PTS system galactitol-specific IIA component